MRLKLRVGRGKRDAPNVSDTLAAPRDWDALSAEEQLALRVDYGRYSDSLPPTCSLDTKQARFRDWLAEHGVRYQPSDAEAFR